MRHSKSLNKVVFGDFLAAFEEDYNYLEDKKSIWETGSDAYEPSSEEDEMESEPSIGKGDENEGNNTVDELEQNVLLEKVDEILMQIVKRLPENHKIRTLTQCMMPYLSPVVDQEQRRQYLIINQNAFIQFLLG